MKASVALQEEVTGGTTFPSPLDSLPEGAVVRGKAFVTIDEKGQQTVVGINGEEPTIFDEKDWYTFAPHVNFGDGKGTRYFGWGKPTGIIHDGWSSMREISAMNARASQPVPPVKRDGRYGSRRVR